MAKTIFASVVLLAAAAMVTWAAPDSPADAKGIHLVSDKTTNLQWVVTDSAGYRWDIAGNGSVINGNNSAYCGGLQLQIQGANFPGYGSAKFSKETNEIEIGPWNTAGLNIYRRVHVDVKGNYCRWIDIFENTGASAVTIPLRYYSNMGDPTNSVETSSGGANIGDDDWGAVIYGGPNTGSNRPAVVHVWGGAGSKYKVKPQINRNGSNEFFYNALLTVPAGKTVALCFFEAQRTPAGGTEFLKGFNPNREASDVSPALRKIILNLGTPSSLLAGVEIRRSDEADMLVLRNGDEMLGQVVTPEFALKTSYGSVKIPAAQAVGLIGVSAESSRVLVVLTGGQVVSGELSGEIKFKLSGGTELSVPPKGVLQVGYRITPQRPSEIPITEPLVQLRQGEQLAFTDSGMTFPFLTAHGQVTLAAADLTALELDNPGGLHRAVFRNGSILGGLIVSDKLSFKLKLGMNLDVDPALVRRIGFVNSTLRDTSLARLTLRNADELCCKLADAKWALAGKVGPVSVDCADVAEAEFPPEGIGQVRLTLRNGTKMQGKLAQEYVAVKVTPGPDLKLFVGHLATLTGGVVPAPVTTASATTKPTIKPAAVAVGDENLPPEVKKIKATLAALDAEGKALQAEADLVRNNNDPARLAEIAKRQAMIEARRAKLAAQLDEAMKAAAMKADAEAEARRRENEATFSPAPPPGELPVTGGLVPGRPR